MLSMRTCLPCHIPDRWSRNANRIWPDLAFGFRPQEIWERDYTHPTAPSVAEQWRKGLVTWCFSLSGFICVEKVYLLKMWAFALDLMIINAAIAKEECVLRWVIDSSFRPALILIKNAMEHRAQIRHQTCLLSAFDSTELEAACSIVRSPNKKRQL